MLRLASNQLRASKFIHMQFAVVLRIFSRDLAQNELRKFSYPIFTIQICLQMFPHRIPTAGPPFYPDTPADRGPGEAAGKQGTRPSRIIPRSPRKISMNTAQGTASFFSRLQGPLIYVLSPRVIRDGFNIRRDCVGLRKRTVIFTDAGAGRPKNCSSGESSRFETIREPLIVAKGYI